MGATRANTTQPRLGQGPCPEHRMAITAVPTQPSRSTPDTMRHAAPGGSGNTRLVLLVSWGSGRGEHRAGMERRLARKASQRGRDADPGGWAGHRGRAGVPAEETAGEWPRRRGSRSARPAGMKTRVEGSLSEANGKGWQHPPHNLNHGQLSVRKQFQASCSRCQAFWTSPTPRVVERAGPPWKTGNRVQGT